MRACGSMVLGAILLSGCAPMLNEAPGWLGATPRSSIYEGAAHPAPSWTPAPRESVIETSAPSVIVVRVPACCAGAVVSVTCAGGAESRPAPAAAPRPMLPSPYGEDEPVPAYKPSPYEEAQPPRLYRID